MKNLVMVGALLWLMPDLPMAADPAQAQTSPQAQVSAQTPVAAADQYKCAAANNRILRPRTRDRPLPLMSGDAARGFRPACSVPWSILSPKDEPLAVEACYRGSLLQIANHQVCPAEKGTLWISARWVVTSAESTLDKAGAVACQHIETQAWAATPQLAPPCMPAGTTPSEPPAKH